MKRRFIVLSILFAVLFAVGGFFLIRSLPFPSGTSVPKKYSSENKTPHLSPDYSGTVLPPNICPLSFRIDGEKGLYYVRAFSEGGEDTVVCKSRDLVRFNEKQWKTLLQKAAGKKLFFEVFVKVGNSWKKYPLVENFVAKESIDPWLSYRYIQGSYLLLNECSIIQRNLESYEEKVLITNNLSKQTCLNCHTCNAGNPSQMMFHVRFNSAGTIIFTGDSLFKSQTQTDELGINGIYPSWHPSGKYIAFSVNAVVPGVYSNMERYMEAFDTISDLALFDIASNTMVACPSVKTKDYNETHPCWSPDGKYLYFARCRKIDLFGSKINQFSDNIMLDSIHYALMRVPFYEDSLMFGEAEEIISVKDLKGKSVSLPRISPDGKFLMFCLHSRGTFASWHRDSDLYLLNMETGDWGPCTALNSKESDSYHSWSRNNRWVSFASKRIDAFYTRLYIAYVDSTGKTYKPFILPQKDPAIYNYQLFLYNLPELVTGSSSITAKDLAKKISTKAEQAKYKFVGGIDSLEIERQNQIKNTDAHSGATKKEKNNKEKKSLHKGFQ